MHKLKQAAGPLRQHLGKALAVDERVSSSLVQQAVGFWLLGQVSAIPSLATEHHTFSCSCIACARWPFSRSAVVAGGGSRAGSLSQPHTAAAAGGSKPQSPAQFEQRQRASQTTGAEHPTCADRTDTAMAGVSVCLWPAGQPDLAGISQPAKAPAAWQYLPCWACDCVPAAAGLVRA